MILNLTNPLVMAGLALIFALGVADDIRGLPALSRLSAQVGLGLIVVVGSLLFTLESTPGGLLVLVGLVWMVTSINVTNFMDGINGITALNAIVISSAYLALALLSKSNIVALAAAVIGISLAFLPWNWGISAKMFLGDSGSYLLGVAIGVIGFTLFLEGLPILIVIAPATIYLVDVTYTIMVRIASRQSLLQPHRMHIYQQLAFKVRYQPRVALLVGTFTLVASTFGVLAAEALLSTATLAVNAMHPTLGWSGEGPQRMVPPTSSTSQSGKGSPSR